MKTEQVEQINAEQFGLKLQVLNKIICQFLNKTLTSQSFLRTCATHNIIILIIQTPEITKKNTIPECTVYLHIPRPAN